MTPTEDSDTIKLAQQGDETAFSCLLDRYYNDIFAFAYRWAGNRSDAEDITQQACIKLARNIDQFRFDAAFTSWLYRLVINCAKDWRKSEQRHQHADSDSSPESHTGSEQHEQQTYLAQVLQRLAQLGDGLHETAILVFAEGMSHKEAGEILAVKESTISWRIHEIRKQLQQQLQQEP